MTNTYYEDDYIDYEEAKHTHESDTVNDEAESSRKTDILRKAPFMRKWLTRLFWLIILMNIIDIMTIDVIVEQLPVLALFGTVAYFICNIIHGYIFWIMKAESRRYKTAAYCMWAGVLITALNDWLNTLSPMQQEEGIILFLMAVVLFISVPVSFYGIYSMYMGHAEVLQNVDTVFSEKWKALWKYLIGTVIAAVASILLVNISLWLGVICMIVAFVVAIVLAIMAMVYLYQMAKLFREFCA